MGFLFSRAAQSLLAPTKTKVEVRNGRRLTRFSSAAGANAPNEWGQNRKVAAGDTGRELNVGPEAYADVAGCLIDAVVSHKTQVRRECEESEMTYAWRFHC